MENKTSWKRFVQFLGQSGLEVFKSIGPPLDSLDVQDYSFAEWGKGADLPRRFPCAVSMSFDGQLSGSLWFIFSRGLVERITRAFLSASLEEMGGVTADVQDALAEVANQLVGDLTMKLRKVYGEGISLNPPRKGTLPDVLKSDDGNFLASRARVAVVVVDAGADQVLGVLADSVLFKAFEGEAENRAAPAAPPAREPAKEAARPGAAAPESRTWAMVMEKEQRSAAGGGENRNIDLIMDISLDVIFRVGTRIMFLKDIMSLNSGVVIELDKSITDPVEIYINDKRIAYGEVVMVEGNYGIRITEIANRLERIRSLGQ